MAPQATPPQMVGTNGLNPLADHVDRVQDALISRLSQLENNCAKKVDLSVYAMKSNLNNYAKKSNLKDDLNNYATKDDLNIYATKDDLKDYATKDVQNDCVETDYPALRTQIAALQDQLMETQKLLGLGKPLEVTKYLKTYNELGQGDRKPSAISIDMIMGDLGSMLLDMCGYKDEFDHKTACKVAIEDVKADIHQFNCKTVKDVFSIVWSTDVILPKMLSVIDVKAGAVFLVDRPEKKAEAKKVEAVAERGFKEGDDSLSLRMDGVSVTVPTDEIDNCRMRQTVARPEMCSMLGHVIRNDDVAAMRGARRRFERGAQDGHQHDQRRRGPHCGHRIRGIASRGDHAGDAALPASAPVFDLQGGTVVSARPALYGHERGQEPHFHQAPAPLPPDAAAGPLQHQGAQGLPPCKEARDEQVPGRA